MTRNHSQSPMRRLKEKIRRRDRKHYHKRNICQICGGIYGQKTEIHHLYYNSERYDKEAIVEVCTTCHLLIHSGDD